MMILVSVCCAISVACALFAVGRLLASGLLHMERNHPGWDLACLGIVLSVIVVCVLTWCIYTILSNF